MQTKTRPTSDMLPIIVEEQAYPGTNGVKCVVKGKPAVTALAYLTVAMILFTAQSHESYQSH